MDEDKYKIFIRPYSRSLKQLLLELEYFIEDININVYSTTSRIKDFNSAIEKSNKLKILIDELQDIAGIRIVVSTDIEKQMIIGFFERKVEVDKMNIIKSSQITNKEGYKAWHVIFEMKGHYTRSVYNVRIEIQIMTIFEYAFNIISRTWVYKSNRKFSNDWKTKFKQLSKDLTKFDSLVSELFIDMCHNSDNLYSDEPLNPLSYQQIVKLLFDEEIELIESVYHVAFITDKGYDTNKKMIDFYNNKEIEKHWIDFDSWANNNISNTTLSMSRRSFYDFYGIRMPKSIEVIKMFKNQIIK
jgi:putative GTP pyrophosphokinase